MKIDVELMATSGRRSDGEMRSESLFPTKKEPGCLQRAGLLLVYVLELGDDA